MFTQEYLTKSKGILLYEILQTVQQILNIGEVRKEDLHRYFELNKRYKAIAGAFAYEVYGILPNSMEIGDVPALGLLRIKDR